MSSVGGVGSYIEYGKQTNFTTALAAGASNRAFGTKQSVSSLSINNNKIDVGDLYNINIQKYVFGKFVGAVSIDADLSNPWFADMYSLNSVDGGAAPFTHTYNSGKLVNAYTIELGINSPTPRVVQLQRATLKDLTISADLESEAKIRYNMQFGTTPLTAGTSMDASVQADDQLNPYHLASSGTVENPSGTPLAQVQSVEFTVNPNITMVYGPGTAAPAPAVNAFQGQLMITGKFQISVLDNTWWNNVMARAEPTNNTLRVKFTNGLAGSSERTVQFTMTGLGLGELNHPTITPNELVQEEIPFTARDIQTIANNNTAAAPT